MLATDTAAYVFNGFTNEQIKAVNFTAGWTFTAMTFFQDSSRFAVGLVNKDGLTSVARYLTVQGIDETTDVSIHADNVNHINSICATADNKRLIYGSQSGDLFLYDIAGN